MKFLTILFGSIYLHIIVTGLTIGFASGMYSQSTNKVDSYTFIGLAWGMGGSLAIRFVKIFIDYLNGKFD